MGVSPLGTAFTPCSVPSSRALLLLPPTADLCPLLPNRPHLLPLGDRQPGPWIPRSGSLRLPVPQPGGACGTLSRPQNQGLYQAEGPMGEPLESRRHSFAASFIPGQSALPPNSSLASFLLLTAAFRTLICCWRLQIWGTHSPPSLLLRIPYAQGGLGEK